MGREHRGPPGVDAAGALTVLTGAARIDPAVSLAVCAVIVWSTWSLLGDSVRMSLAAVPPGIDLAEVRAYLQHQPGVVEVHDLHVWPMSTTETALTCHLVMPAGHPGDGFLMQTAHELQHRFSIGHATIQIETSEQTICPLAPTQEVRASPRLGGAGALLERPPREGQDPQENQVDEGKEREHRPQRRQAQAPEDPPRRIKHQRQHDDEEERMAEAEAVTRPYPPVV